MSAFFNMTSLIFYPHFQTTMSTYFSILVTLWMILSTFSTICWEHRQSSTAPGVAGGRDYAIFSFYVCLTQLLSTFYNVCPTFVFFVHLRQLCLRFFYIYIQLSPFLSTFVNLCPLIYISFQLSPFDHLRQCLSTF